MRHLWCLDLRYPRLAPHRQPLSCESALAVGLAGASLVVPLVMLSRMLRVSKGAEQPTDLPGGQCDEAGAGTVVVIPRRA